MEADRQRRDSAAHSGDEDRDRKWRGPRRDCQWREIRSRSLYMRAALRACSGGRARAGAGSERLRALAHHGHSPLVRPARDRSAARDAARPHHPVDVQQGGRALRATGGRSEEHTSELQSLAYLVCRLLLEKKKKQKYRRLFLKKKSKKTQPK